LLQVARNSQLQQFAGNPNSSNAQVFDLVAGVDQGCIA